MGIPAMAMLPSLNRNPFANVFDKRHCLKYRNWDGILLCSLLSTEISLQLRIVQKKYAQFWSKKTCIGKKIAAWQPQFKLRDMVSRPSRQAVILKKNWSKKLKVECEWNHFGSNKNQSAPNRANTYCNELFLWYCISANSFRSNYSFLNFF